MISKSECKNNSIEQEKPRPCCVCVETRTARDECFLKNSEDAEKRCKDLIKMHIECMRSYGFNI